MDTSDDTTKDIPVAAESIDIYLDKLDVKDYSAKNIPVAAESFWDELNTQNHTTKDISEAVESLDNSLDNTIKVIPDNSERMECSLDELDTLDDPTKDIPVCAVNAASPTKPEDVKTLFPYLKNTNTGSLVLWDFLWALLKDENYKKTVTWVSFPHLKFSIVNPSLLATLFGQVKQDPSMDWIKIKNILDLYIRKNRIISVPTVEHKFSYLIVPKSESTALVSKNATNKDNPVAKKRMYSSWNDTTIDIPVATEKVDNNMFKIDTQ